jgi:hypothetical protein
MSATTFDTLMQSKKLQDKGFTAEQAEATVEMLKEVIDTQLATKQDINDLRRDMRELEYRIISRIGGMIVIAVGILAAIIKL